jgi:hypothetical protein
MEPAARDISGKACKVFVKVSRIWSAEDVTSETTSR